MPEEAKFISVLEAALLLHLVFSSQTFFFPQNPAYYLYPSLINNPPLPPFRLFCTCVGVCMCVCAMMHFRVRACECLLARLWIGPFTMRTLSKWDYRSCGGAPC